MQEERFLKFEDYLLSFLKSFCFSCEMEADVVMQGDQLLYSNQFDELTYNADKIVQITSQLDEVLKRFSYSFSNKDSVFIINKNLTAFLYWLVIDALYFSHSTSYEVDRVNYLRKKRITSKGYSSIWGQPNQMDKFIIKMRTLAMKNIKGQILQNVKETSVEELIELFEKQHQNISQKNDERLNSLSNKTMENKEIFNSTLQRLRIPIVAASPLLAYYIFEKQMIRTWMDLVDRRKIGAKCQICSRTDRLIKCQKCDLQVHPYCYSKLPNNYALAQFVCENCQKNLDQKTQCIFCPLKGGQFLEVNYPADKRLTYTICKSQGLMKLRIKKLFHQKQRSFIHLSCSLWHTDLEYNTEKGMIENIHRIDRKKPQNSCYQCGTNLGVTIPCANQNCRRFYHPQCARRIQLGTCIINAKNKMLIQLYCQRHRRPYIYQILKQNILNNLKQIKKLYEGIDHEIKRMLSSSFSSDRKIPIKSDQPERYEGCLYCQQLHDDGLTYSITNCCKCYNWYHKQCGNKCPICQEQPIVAQKQ